MDVGKNLNSIKAVFGRIRNTPLVVVIWMLFYVIYFVANWLSYEDYLSSVAGYALIPTDKQYPEISLKLVAALPQLTQWGAITLALAWSTEDATVDPKYQAAHMKYLEIARRVLFIAMLFDISSDVLAKMKQALQTENAQTALFMAILVLIIAAVLYSVMVSLENVRPYLEFFSSDGLAIWKYIPFPLFAVWVIPVATLYLMGNSELAMVYGFALPDTILVYTIGSELALIASVGVVFALWPDVWRVLGGKQDNNMIPALLFLMLLPAAILSAWMGQLYVSIAILGFGLVFIVVFRAVIRTDFFATLSVPNLSKPKPETKPKRDPKRLPDDDRTSAPPPPKARRPTQPTSRKKPAPSPDDNGRTSAPSPGRVQSRQAKQRPSRPEFGGKQAFPPPSINLRGGQ